MFRSPRLAIIAIRLFGIFVDCALAVAIVIELAKAPMQRGRVHFFQNPESGLLALHGIIAAEIADGDKGHVLRP